MSAQDGPKVVTSYRCEGCVHLETEYWKWYGDNDDTDSGTRAKCKKMDKHIDSYWNTWDSPPSWCPLLPRRELVEAVAKLPRIGDETWTASN